MSLSITQSIQEAIKEGERAKERQKFMPYLKSLDIKSLADVFQHASKEVAEENRIKNAIGKWDA